MLRTLNRMLAIAVLVAGSPARAATCDLPGTLPTVVINELLVKASVSKEEYVELKGEPNLPLDCMVLRPLNGGTAADQCTPEPVIKLDGKTIGANGYFLGAATAAQAGATMVDSKFDLQNGPDAVALVFVASSGSEAILDVVTYGKALPSCDARYVEGTPTVTPNTDQSLSRCPDGADTNDNGKDVVVAVSPTPGVPNDCPAAPTPCTGAAPLVINELLVDTALTDDGGAFIELKGAPGTALSCYALVPVEGSDCTTDAAGAIALTGQYIGQHGYFAVASSADAADADLYTPLANLENGPDGVRLVYHHDALGDLVVDEVFYGTKAAGCAAGEGNAAPKPPQGSSLARLPDGTDTGDNAADFKVCASPSVSAANACGSTPTGCTEAVPAPLLINEALLGAGTTGSPEFLELKGTPGTALGCYVVQEVNGKGCETYKELPLSGALPDDGYFVIGKTEQVPGVDLVSTGGDLQNGPDGVRVVYKHDTLGVLVLDALAYGEGDDLATCAIAEGTAAAKPANGQSLARLPDGTDTGDNAADFALCDFPSPGEANKCTGLTGCTTVDASLVLNEVLVRTDASGTQFIEIKGTPGTDLACYSLEAINGSGCATYDKIQLAGWIPADGYYVVGANEKVTVAEQIDSGAALQVGPDALDLVYHHSETGPVLVDRLVYGGEALTCDVAEGDPAGDAPKEHSLARFPDGVDTGNNGTDFVDCDTPTPGLANQCSPPPCSGNPPDVLINEIVVAVVTDSPISPFVELKAAPGTDLSCFRLIGVNGTGCGPYNLLDLEGTVPEGGYFLIADGDKLTNAQMVSSKADFQDGPDGLDLVYQSAKQGDIVVDSLAWGEEAIPDCGVGEGDIALPPGKGSSLARPADAADTGDNSKDFTVCAEPTPGAANTCTGPGDDPGDPTKNGGGGGAACAVASSVPNPAPALISLVALSLLLVVRRRRAHLLGSSDDRAS